MASPSRQHLRIALSGIGLALLLALGLLIAQGAEAAMSAIHLNPRRS